MHLFTYGTLMDPEIMAHVSGGQYRSRPARLSGYRRRVVSGEVYPAIVPCAAEGVEGMVYFSLSGNSLERLDRFEGEYYERRTLLVECEGEQLQVQGYVLLTSYRHLLSSSEWRLADFQHSGKVRFSSHYTGYQRIGQSSDQESET